MTDDVKIFATAGLIILDALVLYEALSKYHSSLKPIDPDDTGEGLIDKLEEARKIVPSEIFPLAIELMRDLPSSPTLDKALGDLIKLAKYLNSSYRLIRSDLMGRLYHRLLVGRSGKYQAALYTSIPAARLLAKLALGLPSRFNIYEAAENGKWRIVDFACGSGTLLLSVYREVELVGLGNLNSKALHKYLVEEGLWGFDVMRVAVVLAGVNLILQNPSVRISKFRLYSLPLGIRSSPRMGSLDFLDTEGILPKFHLCIMNPPFARSVGGNLIFGSLPPNERKILQEKLKTILNRRGMRGLGKAGLGAVFFILADKYLEVGGRIALVLPKAVLSGASWSKVREILLNNYHVEFVISSFEPGEWNFSEDTSMSEVLIIARKLERGEVSGHTIFVNLFRKPKAENEASYLGSLLLKLYAEAESYDIHDLRSKPYNLEVLGEKVGEAYSARVKGQNLVMYQVMSDAELNRAIVMIREGQVYLPQLGLLGSIPVVPLSTYIELIGPDRSQIHNAFRSGDFKEGCEYPALWGHKSDKIKTIEVRPNRCLTPLNEKGACLWRRGGRLLMAERVRLSTSRVVAVFSPKKVLSNVWWPLKVRSIEVGGRKVSDREMERIIALWMNSFFGLLSYLSQVVVTEGPWLSMKKYNLRGIPTLDISSLSPDKLDDILSLYHEASMSERDPISYQIREVMRRSVSRVDRALLEVLGLKLP